MAHSLDPATTATPTYLFHPTQVFDVYGEEYQYVCVLLEDGTYSEPIRAEGREFAFPRTAQGQRLSDGESVSFHPAAVLALLAYAEQEIAAIAAC